MAYRKPQKLGSPLAWKERELFTLLAEGHTPKACAQLINRGYDMVRVYIGNVKERLGVKTTLQAMFVLTSKGIIHASQTSSSKRPVDPAGAAYPHRIVKRDSQEEYP